VAYSHTAGYAFHFRGVAAPRAKEADIAWTLLNLAADARLPVALHARATVYLNLEVPQLWVGGELDLMRASKRGYPPALVELIDRHRRGDRIERDDPHAYYWALHGRRMGVNLDAVIAELEATLRPDQARQVREAEGPSPLLD
jgi:hypothetical protein